MSDKQLYEILANFNKVALNEGIGKTEIKQVGNKVEVNDEDGDVTTYDEKSWDDKQDDEEKSAGATGFNEGMEDDIINDKYASDLDIDAPEEFALGDFSVGTDDDDVYGDDIGMDFNFEAEESDGFKDEYASELDIDNPDEFSLGDFSVGTDDDDVYGDDVGMDFSFEGENTGVDVPFDDKWGGAGENLDTGQTYVPSEYDDFEEPEYTPFDFKDQGKRLRAGTPIVFDDSIGGGNGTFIEKSPSGFFGTAERNGKSISIHLSDIVAADLINDSIYENFETKFDKLMEGMDMSAGQTPYAPGEQEQTVTITAEVPVDSLVDILKLTGLSGQESDQGVYSQVPTGQEMAQDELGQEPSMQDMMSTVGDEQPDTEEPVGEEGDEPENESMNTPYGSQQGGPSPEDDDKEIETSPRDDDDERFDRFGNAIDPANESYGEEKQEGDAPYQNYKKDEASDQYDKKSGEWSKGDDDDGDDKEEQVDEEYSNEPDEKYASADTQLNAMSGGLNKQKRMFKKEYPGDNQMVDEETDSFLNLYKAFQER